MRWTILILILILKLSNLDVDVNISVLERMLSNVTLIFRPWITCSKKQRRGQKRQLSDLLIILMCLLVSGDIHQCPGPGSCKGGEGVCPTFAADGRRALGAEQCRRSEIGVEWSLMADQWSDLRPCNETRFMSKGLWCVRYFFYDGEWRQDAEDSVE